MKLRMGELSLRVSPQKCSGIEAAKKCKLFTAFDHVASRTLGEWCYFLGVKRVQPELACSSEAPSPPSPLGVDCETPPVKKGAAS